MFASCLSSIAVSHVLLAECSVLLTAGLFIRIFTSQIISGWMGSRTARTKPRPVIFDAKANDHKYIRPRQK